MEDSDTQVFSRFFNGVFHDPHYEGFPNGAAIRGFLLDTIKWEYSIERDFYLRAQASLPRRQANLLDSPINILTLHRLTEWGETTPARSFSSAEREQWEEHLIQCSTYASEGEELLTTRVPDKRIITIVPAYRETPRVPTSAETSSHAIAYTPRAINALIPILKTHVRYPIRIHTLTQQWPSYFNPVDLHQHPCVDIDTVYQDLRRLPDNDAPLALGPSLLRGAGIGLYAINNITSGYRLDTYTGPQFDTETSARLAGRNHFPNFRTDGYNDGIYDNLINGDSNRYTLSDYRCYSYYANDPLGYLHYANAKFIWDPSDRRPILVTTDNVERGDEILVAYGADYWYHFQQYLSTDGKEALQMSYGPELDKIEARVRSSRK
jgi:hypothetical protein